MKSYSIVLLLLVVFAGCKSAENSGPANPNSTTAATPTPAAPGNPATSTTNPAPTVKSKVDVCNLLTSDELKRAQGEAYKEAQRSDRQDGDFIVAQCYYQMPTMADSVVLNVTTATERAGAPNPRDFWERTFREADEKDREGKKSEREREKQKDQKDKAKERRAGEEEEEALPPERVKGLGDEAFWSASRIGGALYVLKNDQFFRISIGGSADARAKLNRSKMLAQIILKKL
jgi:hypothetical protein